MFRDFERTPEARLRPVLVTGPAALEVTSALSRRHWSTAMVGDEESLCSAAYKMRNPLAVYCDSPTETMLRRICLWGGTTWDCGDFDHPHPYCIRVQVYGPGADYGHYGIDGDFETWSDAIDDIIDDMLRAVAMQ